MVPASVAQPKESPKRETGFMLPDLLSSGAVPLGTLRSHNFWASYDDIESQNYLHFVSDRRNALVISAYVTQESCDGALGRAVLNKLKAILSGDYNNLCSRFNNKGTPPVGIVLPFKLNISAKDRSLFPVDDLIVVTFERESSGSETFDWVTDAFKIAKKQKTENLIVPCLGRQWTEIPLPSGTSFPVS
jgi:hypothetical protein